MSEVAADAPPHSENQQRGQLLRVLLYKICPKNQRVRCTIPPHVGDCKNKHAATAMAAIYMQAVAKKATNAPLTPQKGLRRHISLVAAIKHRPKNK